MEELDSTGGQQTLYEALQHLRSAVELLDSSNAPAQIAAHVDLAIHQLQDALTRNSLASELIDRPRSRDCH